MSLPGYDQWLTTDPASLYPDEPLPGDPDWPRCECGAWLRLEADSREADELRDPCDGRVGDYEATCGSARSHPPHMFTSHAWEVEHRVCRKCGRDNERVVA